MGRVYENGKYRDMTEKEIQLLEELTKARENEVSLEERISALEEALIELINEVEE